MAHPEYAEMLDLVVEVLHEYHQTVIALAGAAAPERPRIVDVGAGAGAGTLALARHLPDAEVIAVDVAEPMLDHLIGQARARGLDGRVRTVQADLDGPWPPLGPADLVWASASLHHLADPGHAPAQAFAMLRPGGVFVVTELDSFPRFLPDGADAALEDRCHAALAELRTEAGLHMHEDWGARLRAAGFTVEVQRRFDIALRAPLPAAAGRYAEVCLRRMCHGLDGRLAPGDLTALTALADGVSGRTDLTVRAARTVWLARRPA